MPLKKYHITQGEDGEWRATKEDGKRASFKSETKKEVFEQIRDMAKRQGDVSIVIHKRDGKIQEERTYPRSSDPTDSKG